MNPMEIKNVLMIDAGTISHIIAQIYATTGIDVSLFDYF